jgi:hypothetical protein
MMFIKDAAAYMPAHYLFEKKTYPFAAGVNVFQSENDARKYTVRRKNVLALNQWFRVLIPSRDHFLELNRPLANQPPGLIESLLSTQALDSISEEKPDYSEKRKFLYSLESAEAYLLYLNQKVFSLSSAIPPHDGLSKTLSYLSFYGTAGIILPHYDDGESYLVFDARQNIIIKEIHREHINHTILVS